MMPSHVDETSHLSPSYGSNSNRLYLNHGSTPTYTNGGTNIPRNAPSCSMEIAPPEGQFSDADSINHPNSGRDSDNSRLRPQVFLDSNKEVPKPKENSSTEIKDDDNAGRFKFKTMSRRQRLLLVFCIGANFTAGCSFSLLGPFFPQEASKKGMSITVTGFVFSVFELVIFITSPIFGSNLTRLGPKFVFVAGVFVGGSCNILFGTLDKSPSGAPFIAICIACRMVEAVGFSAFVTALLAVISNEFPKDVATAISVLETANGVGLMVGPAIGGWLYDLGGYGLPFYVVGTIVIINGALIYTFIPDPEILGVRKKMSKILFLKSPMVLIGMATITCGCIGISLLDPMLANHLEPFNLSVSVIGLMFIIGPSIYTLFSPLWGYLSDRKGYYSQLMVMGLFFFGVGYLFIGPSRLLPFLPFELWTVTVGLIITGCVFGCTLFPSMKCMTVGSQELGFEENLDTYAVLAGLLNSMYSLGAFTGPMVGGVLAQNLGYSATFTIVGLLNIVMSVVALIYFLQRYFSRKKDVENISLVHGNSFSQESGNSNRDFMNSVKAIEEIEQEEEILQRRNSFSNPFIVRSMSLPKAAN